MNDLLYIELITKYVKHFKGFNWRVQFTHQWPRNGVILPLEIWVGNDGMMITFFFFLPQIQKSFLYPFMGNHKSSCLNLLGSISGSTNTFERRGEP
jgi:hypothetical protein